MLVADKRARMLGELEPEEQETITAAIHREAAAAGWHRLSTARKSSLYGGWEERYDLSHQTVKDRIMKGFDASQHIPPSGEAAIHTDVWSLLRSSVIPYVQSKVRRQDWRREVDFVWGFSDRFLTHIAELEPARTWETGLFQALLYKSHYYQETAIQALPTLILFGDVTSARWDLVQTVRADQRVLLLTYDLRRDGDPVGDDLCELLASTDVSRQIGV